MSDMQKTIPAVTDYTPSVADRIQRVLYRLEHGEKLGSLDLYDGQNFCVLGIFADESGLGDWQYDSHSLVAIGRDRFSFHLHDIDLIGNGSLLHSAVTKLYGLKTDTGLFELADLPDDLRKQVVCLYNKTRVNNNVFSKDPKVWSIASLNDACLVHDPESTNQLLAKIIRSGVIFNS